MLSATGQQLTATLSAPGPGGPGAFTCAAEYRGPRAAQRVSSVGRPGYAKEGKTAFVRGRASIGVYGGGSPFR